MFVAWRDLRFARGRFLLIALVVTLITVLVGFLSGLTAGLAHQNISAIRQLDADRIVFSQASHGAAVSYGDSVVTAADQKAWATKAGVNGVEPLGISQGKATGRSSGSVAIFGSDGTRPGTIQLSAPAAKALDVSVGSDVMIGGEHFKATQVGGDDWYSHTPVIRMNLGDWQRANPATYATVLLIDGKPAAGDVPGTVSSGVTESLTAIGAFRSEIGSLLMMVGMLFGISALVIGAFFTVWTIQRRSDIAVLKALGASNPMLIRDALGQALLILTGGVGLGIVLTAGLGAVVQSSLPFVLSPLTTALPAAAMIVLGLAGATFALRSVTSTDPLTALGSNR